MSGVGAVEGAIVGGRLGESADATAEAALPAVTEASAPAGLTLLGQPSAASCEGDTCSW